MVSMQYVILGIFNIYYHGNIFRNIFCHSSLCFCSLSHILCLCNLSHRYSFWRGKRLYFWVLSHYFGRLFCCAGLPLSVPSAGEGHNPAQTGRSASLGLSMSAYDPAGSGNTSACLLSLCAFQLALTGLASGPTAWLTRLVKGLRESFAPRRTVRKRRGDTPPCTWPQNLLRSQSLLDSRSSRSPQT